MKNKIPYQEQITNQTLMQYLEVEDVLELEEKKKAEDKITELGDYNISKYNEDWQDE